MSDVPLKSITFPGLTDRYTLAQIDPTLTVSNAAADAKATGDEIANVKSSIDDYTMGRFPAKPFWYTDIGYLNNGRNSQTQDTYAKAGYIFDGFSRVTDSQSSSTFAVTKELHEKCRFSQLALNAKLKIALWVKLAEGIDSVTARYIYFNTRYTFSSSTGRLDAENKTLINGWNEIELSCSQVDADERYQDYRSFTIRCASLNAIKSIKSVYVFDNLAISSDLNNALVYPETIVFTPGAVDSSGNIIAQTSNKEVISQKLYGVNKVSVSITYSLTHTIYVWAAQYKADGTFIDRTRIIGVSDATTATGSIITDKDCAYVIIMFRTYDDTYSIDTNIVSFRLKSTVEKIQDVLTTLDAMGNHIPQYWNDEIAESEASIVANRVNMGANGVEFFFVTDTHWKEYGSVEGNTKLSGEIIGLMSHDLEIPLVICGGDVILGHKDTKAAAIAELNEFYTAYNKGFKLITTVGNHDTNANNNSSHPEAHLTAGEMYALMERRQEDFMDTTASIDHSFYDNISQKVRFIQFNHYGETGPSENSYAIANWIEEKVQELPSGWTVVLFSHSYFKVGKNEQQELVVTIPNGCEAWAQWFANLQEDPDTKATIACWIVGHVHRDLSDTTNGILVISSNCDCAPQSAMWGGLTMTPGTDTEQCIDCFQINTADKTIAVTRIGAGSDRTFDYDPSSLTFGETTNDEDDL